MKTFILSFGVVAAVALMVGGCSSEVDPTPETVPATEVAPPVVTPKGPQQCAYVCRSNPNIERDGQCSAVLYNSCVSACHGPCDTYNI